MAGEGSVRAHVLVLLLAVLATAGAPTRCDARLACEAVHLTTGLDCSQDLCVPSNITAGTTSCSPERCYCRIDAAGLPGDGFVFRNGTARCFTFDALDKHHYLRVVVRADHEFARVSGYVTSSTGPEDEPRLRWETETGGPPASGGFEAYPISSTESFSLSREEWRRSASEDEGEWEGTWSVCLNATLSAESETETTRVTVSANSSRCPLGERDRVCSGRGSCVKTSWNCGVAPTCSRYVCSCDDFFAGEDCSVRIPGGGGRGPMPGPEEEESGEGSDGDVETGGPEDAGGTVPRPEDYATGDSKHERPDAAIPTRGGPVGLGDHGSRRAPERANAAPSYAIAVLGVAVLVTSLAVARRRLISSKSPEKAGFILLDPKKRRRQGQKHKGRDVEMC